jgi:predicted flap endonuclease-1-like 5' DNA nuclease/predicted  nucleic acid-binding Zn-ribbon protein
MRTELLASLFCMDNILPILTGLLGAALLGWLLKHFMGSGNNNAAADWQAKYDAAMLSLQKEKDKYAKLQADAKNKKGNATPMASSATKDAAELDALQNRVKNLQAEAKAANDDKLRLEAEVNKANNLAREASTLNSEVITLKSRIDGLTKAIDSAKTETEKYRNDYNEANSERSRLSAQLANSDIGAMQSKINKLEKDLDSARITTSNLQVEIDRLKRGEKTVVMNTADTPKTITIVDEEAAAKVKELEAALNAANASNARLTADAENTKLYITAAVNEANKKSNSELIDVREKLKNAEFTINKLQEDKNKLAAAVGSTVISNSTVSEVAKPAPSAPTQADSDEPAKPAPVLDILKDDLTVVEGIGPKIAELLNENGIVNYGQLANASVETLQEILDRGGERFKVHDPGTWAEQSALLRDGNMDAFNKLCEELKGGKRE